MNNFKPQKGILLILFSAITLNSKSQDDFIWGRQFGSDKNEYTLNHVIDKNGNIYISGKTDGSFNGANAGKNDGFLTKIDSLGNLLWSQQFGTSGEENILWSAIDSQGNVFITGSTTGALVNNNLGKGDIFLVKYSPDGNLEWKKQFGTDSLDIAESIFIDNQNFIYLTGTTSGKMGKSISGKEDLFMMKLDPEGKVLFTEQYGTSENDGGISITGDKIKGDKIYICGTTWGKIGAAADGMIDAYLGYFTNKGELIRFSQFGTDGFDIALQLIQDEKLNVYVGGTTSGSLSSAQMGNGDCFLAKFDQNGNRIWTNQFGTKMNDGIRGIAYNSEVSENIFVSGIFNLPPSKSFIRSYNTNGTLLWEKCFKGNEKGNCSGKDVNLDRKGFIYHLGLTNTNLFSPLNGGPDVFIVKMGLNK